MKLSVVSTLYYSASYIREFCERIIKVIPKEFSEYEIILVDDGSPDNSLDVAISMKKEIPDLKVIELSRNFGHHKAIMTGLEMADGDFVFLIDSDLEEEPELLSEFWNSIRENNEVDAVFGVQVARKGGWFEKFTGKVYYKVFNWFAEKNLKTVENITTVRIMKSNYVRTLVKYKPIDFYFGPACDLIGYKQNQLPVSKKSTSPSTYKFLTKYHLMINSLFSTSVKPLYIMFYSGLSITFIAFIYAIAIVFRVVFKGTPVDGWASTIVSIFLLSGIIITFLGVTSIYISKIMKEVKPSPFSIIKNIH
jgi:putative glycosyltransferase